MTTSVGMKARKKQSPKREDLTAPLPSASRNDTGLERALLTLESVCMRILEDRMDNGSEDAEQLCWKQRLKNIVTPVSLALVECKGPRRFHYHYRHRAEDESILHPVLEPTPETLLVQVCEYALWQCDSKLTGNREQAALSTQRTLESALRNFMIRHQAGQKKTA